MRPLSLCPSRLARPLRPTRLLTWAGLGLVACGPALAQVLAAPAAAASAPTEALTTDTTPEPTGVHWQVQVEAPGAVRDLLRQHLDVSRYAQSARKNNGKAGDDSAPPLAIGRGELARLVAATPAQARELLQTEGYFDAQVRAELQAASADAADAAEAPLQVRVSVVPGPRTEVGAVRVEFVGALSAAADSGDATAQALVARLRDGFALPPGQPFTQAAWRDAKNTLLGTLRAEGYGLAAFSGTSAEVDAAAHRASLYLVADSGPQVHISGTVLEGLHHVDAAAVQALLTYRSGDVLREQALQDLQDRLVKTNLFDTVTVSAPTTVADGDLPDTAADRLDVPVTVRVQERALQQATVGVGVSDITGPRVTLEHVHQRPFGLAWQAKSKIQLGRDERSASIDLLSHPQPGPYRNLVSGAIGRTEASGLVVLSQNLRVGRTQDLEKVERLVYVQFERDVTRSQGTGLVTDDTSAVSLNNHWIWRRLDNPLLPVRGHSVSLELGAGRSFHTDDDSGFFGRTAARYTGYWPVGDAWFTQGRLQVGQVFAQASTAVPYTQLFRAGGDDSVRGYANQSLGPTDATGNAEGGRVLATASAEIARPFTARTPQFWWATFVDAGNAARNWRDFDPALGYGVGVRWRSPVGPLRIDLAYGNKVHKARLHFTIGVTF